MKRKSLMSVSLKQALCGVLLLGGAAGSASRGGARWNRPEWSGTGRPAQSAALDELLVNKSLWGKKVSNTVKGMSVAYDGKRGLAFVSGIATRYLMVIDPAQSHPSASIDLGVSGTHTSSMRVDETRRRLFWVGRTDESIRVIDLDTRKVVASRDVAGAPAGHHPVKDVALDPETGWIWIANLDNHAVTGYSADLKSSASIPGLSGPISVAAAPGGDLLYVLDAQGRSETRLLRYRPSAQDVAVLQTYSSTLLSPPPKLVHVTPDGAILVVNREVRAYAPDTLQTLWTASLPVSPESVVSVNGTAAFMLRKAGFERGYPESLVQLRDSSTGAALATVKVRFEASWAAADPEGERLLVGNGGDGSVSVISTATRKVLGTIDAGNGAEGVAIDSRTGTKYILNRLGGSEIYVQKAGSTKLERWEAGKWPTELAVDPDRRRLFALSHYESAIYRWNLSSNTRMSSLSLGVPGNTGDSLCDFDYDAATGIAGAVFPETGYVAAADMAAGRVLWTRRFADFAVGPDRGPGNAFVLVDGTRSRLYVVWTLARRLSALDLRTGATEKEYSFPHSLDTTYAINAACLDPTGDRLFVGPDVVDLDTLQLTQSLSSVNKIFYADGDIALGMVLDSDDIETLVELDANTLAVKRQWSLVSTGMMRLVPTYDPSSGRIYFADLPNARVLSMAYAP